jgi:multicomponent K+:H+ antiporter subunit G
MSHAAELPVWAALLVAAFLILGAGLALLGSFGLVRLRSFYDRIHAPTLGVSWGTAGVVIASMILFTTLQSRPVVHEILIGIFVTVTTPVTLMLLGRAALYRDRAEHNPDVPSTNPPSGALGPSEPTENEGGR